MCSETRPNAKPKNVASHFNPASTILMSKGIDIQIVRENYQRMADDEVIRIATQDAAGLTPEAQKVVKEEIEKRNLDRNIIKGVLVQNKEYTVEEIGEYCMLARNLSCPTCGSNMNFLNGTITSEVMSFIFFTQYNRKLKVACPTCLDKSNNNALIKTIILGCGEFPGGYQDYSGNWT